MKLIFCTICQDVVKAGWLDRRSCECGHSWAQYLDEVNAEYGGRAVPLGFDNKELAFAIKNQPADGMGKVFAAFVIPTACPTYRETYGTESKSG